MGSGEDKSRGVWEAVRDGGETPADGFPRMKFVVRDGDGKPEASMPFPASVEYLTMALS